MGFFRFQSRFLGSEDSALWTGLCSDETIACYFSPQVISLHVHPRRISNQLIVSRAPFAILVGRRSPSHTSILFRGNALQQQVATPQLYGSGRPGAIVAPASFDSFPRHARGALLIGEQQGEQTTMVLPDDGSQHIDRLLGLCLSEDGKTAATAKKAVLKVLAWHPSPGKANVRLPLFDAKLSEFRSLLISQGDADAFIETGKADEVAGREPGEWMDAGLDIRLRGGELEDEQAAIDGVEWFMKWLQYADIRERIFRRMSERLEDGTANISIALDILAADPPTFPMQRYFSTGEQPKPSVTYSTYIRRLLRNEDFLESDEHRRQFLLLVRDTKIFSKMKDPRLTMTFFETAFTSGGFDAVLALKGLCELMTKYHLEFPNFYQHVYDLLVPEVVEIEQQGCRDGLFELVEMLLKSGLISLNLKAAFLKRLTGLMLRSSTPVVLALIPLIYNMVRSDVGLRVLLHREYEDGETAKEIAQHHDEGNLNATHALRSSLWEISSMQNHFVPTISKLSRLFEGLTRENLKLEDFLADDYGVSLVGAAQAETGGLDVTSSVCGEAQWDCRGWREAQRRLLSTYAACS